jgi:Lrp/AsnC family leucine-responsive transcriptional regulator
VTPPLEPIDQAILRELTADGRCSFTDLAERVGLSVSAVHQRVRRLEQRGVVRGYAARVAGPTALEELLRQIREQANVSTRTTVVLSTPYEDRPPGV